jgi:alkylation response protein AidB-like acyl-CoA dehydrogenase
MIDLDTLKHRLRKLEEPAETLRWPEEQFALLADADCWRPQIGKRFGGLGATPVHRLHVYESVARGSLTLALILTQHDAACGLIERSENTALAERLLPQCARGEVLTTVGISQLTTSRRGSGPAMRADRAEGGLRLNGFMPWVTSATRADYIVTGAVLADGQQILACVPTDMEGLAVGDPVQLMGLTPSLTCQVRCENVLVTSEHLLRGPAEQVLALRGPIKPLTVSSVGVGFAGALMEAIRERTARDPDAIGFLDREVAPSYSSVRQSLFDAAEALDDPAAEIPGMEIRAAVNDLVVRLAITLLTYAKGSGYTMSHPAQRLVREAMFFLVWSAPTDVQVGTLRRMWKGVAGA